MATTVSYHALYSDGRSYQVIYDPAQRRTYLATADTADGRMPVPYYVDGAEFVDFEFRGFPGMLPSAAWAERAKMDQLLTRPVKTEPPRVQHEADHALHVEPGGNPFRRLQEAGARAEAEYRASRNRQRQQIQNVLNLGDPRREQEARRVNTEANALRQRPKN